MWYHLGGDYLPKYRAADTVNACREHSLVFLQQLRHPVRICLHATDIDVDTLPTDDVDSIVGESHPITGGHEWHARSRRDQQLFPLYLEGSTIAHPLP
jgi:hypothetical protein